MKGEKEGVPKRPPFPTSVSPFSISMPTHAKALKSSSIVNPIGDKGYYQKKIKKVTNQYDHVKGTLNTGLTIDKLKKKIGDAHMNARFRREEHFKRIKRVQLNQIMKEDEIVFLILDLRDSEQYEKCHLQGAINYPAPWLTRSVNQFVEQPLILQYQNKSDRLIIAYDYNEEIAIKTCNLFFEKGFDNVVMLSGGLRRFAEKYSELIEGDIPPPPKQGTTKYQKGPAPSRYATSVRSNATSVRTTRSRLSSSLLAKKRNLDSQKKPVFR